MDHWTYTSNSKGSVYVDADQKKVSVNGDYQFGNVFGNKILVMEGDLDIVYKYDLKISQCDTIYLGIIQEDKINEVDGYQPFTNKGCGFALRDDGNLYSPKQAEDCSISNDPYFDETAINGTFKAGDAVAISLHSKASKLVFKINNDENKIIIINNIPKLNYKIAAYLYGSAEYDQPESGGASTIKLCSYSCQVHHKTHELEKKENDERDQGNKLEDVIRNFNQIIEKKDKQIQELYQKNQHQQQAILELQAENAQLQRLADEFKDSQKAQQQQQGSGSYDRSYGYHQPQQYPAQQPQQYQAQREQTSDVGRVAAYHQYHAEQASRMQPQPQQSPQSQQQQYDPSMMYSSHYVLSQDLNNLALANAGSAVAVNQVQIQGQAGTADRNQNNQNVQNHVDQDGSRNNNNSASPGQGPQMQSRQQELNNNNHHLAPTVYDRSLYSPYQVFKE